jgi:four helix bundle protein
LSIVNGHYQIKICMPFKFEKLEIWNLALQFAHDVHIITRKFPKEELFNLTSQFKRAADSVSLNIAEGSIGQSDPEQRKFVGYAIRSIAECVIVFTSPLKETI